MATKFLSLLGLFALSMTGVHGVSLPDAAKHPSFPHHCDKADENCYAHCYPKCKGNGVYVGREHRRIKTGIATVKDIVAPLHHRCYAKPPIKGQPRKGTCDGTPYTVKTAIIKNNLETQGEIHVTTSHENFDYAMKDDLISALQVAIEKSAVSERLAACVGDYDNCTCRLSKRFVHINGTEEVHQVDPRDPSLYPDSTPVQNDPDSTHALNARQHSPPPEPTPCKVVHKDQLRMSKSYYVEVPAHGKKSTNHLEVSMTVTEEKENSDDEACTDATTAFSAIAGAFDGALGGIFTLAGLLCGG